MLKQKIKITLITPEWEVIDTLKVEIVPRFGDKIYISSEDKYYNVVDVIHSINNRDTSVCVVVKETEKTLIKG